MTESEWLAGDDVALMLAWAERNAVQPGHAGGPLANLGPRKLRLFACARVRRVWHLLADERSRRAVEAAERFADGLATGAELDAAWDAAWAAARAAARAPRDAASHAAWDAAWAAHAGAAWAAARAPAAAHAGALLREIVGNPWRPVPFDPARRTATVLSLARAAYEDRPGKRCRECVGEAYLYNQYGGRLDCPGCRRTGRVEDGALDPGRMAILADALEEAGFPAAEECRACGGLGGWGSSAGRRGGPGGQAVTACRDCEGEGHVPAPLLDHLRGPGPHVRGCWALDLILGQK